MTDSLPRDPRPSDVEAKFAAFLASAVEGYGEYDPTDDRHLRSEQYFRILGESPTTFPPTGRAFDDRIHPDDYQRVLEGDDRVLTTGEPVQQQFRMRRADGTWVLVEERTVRVDIDGRSHLVAAIRDVSKESQAERALRRSAELYRILFGTTNGPAFHFTADGELLDANASALDYFEVGDRPVVGMPLEHLVGADNGRLVMAACDDDTVTNLTLEVGEEEVRRYVVLTMIPCLLEERATVFSLGVDITTEVELRMSLEEKSRMLADANTALRVVLDQSDTSRRDFEQGIANNLEMLVYPMLDRLQRALRSKYEQVQVEAIRGTLQDVARPLKHQVLGGLEASEPLTQRELEVLNFIKRGLTSQEIADALQLSVRTVAFHRGNIRKKIGLHGAKNRLMTSLIAQETTD